METIATPFMWAVFTAFVIALSMTSTANALVTMSISPLLTDVEEQPQSTGPATDLLAGLREGQRFSAVLAEQPELFPPLYIGIVKAAGTNMEEMGDRIALLTTGLVGLNVAAPGAGAPVGPDDW